MGIEPTLRVCCESAGNPYKQGNKGCSDAKAKTYDRVRHNAAYEAGWNACKGD